MDFDSFYISRIHFYWWIYSPNFIFLCPKDLILMLLHCFNSSVSLLWKLWNLCILDVEASHSSPKWLNTKETLWFLNFSCFEIWNDILVTTTGLCGTTQVSCRLIYFRKLLIKSGLNSSEHNQWRGNMPQSKNIIETLTNIRHFGGGGRKVRKKKKKKDNSSKILTHTFSI